MFVLNSFAHFAFSVYSQALPEIPLVVSRASVDSFMTGIRQAAISLVPAFAGLDANDEGSFKIDQVYGVGVITHPYLYTR